MLALSKPTLIVTFVTSGIDVKVRLFLFEEIYGRIKLKVVASALL